MHASGVPGKKFADNTAVVKLWGSLGAAHFLHKEKSAEQQAANHNVTGGQGVTVSRRNLICSSCSPSCSQVVR